MRPTTCKPFFLCRALALAAALFAAHATSAPLSPMEQRLAADVRPRTGEAIKELEATVNINSGTMNHAGVRDVGKLYRAEFEKLGFKTHWIELPTEMRRAGHLVATREGKQKAWGQKA